MKGLSYATMYSLTHQQRHSDGSDSGPCYEGLESVAHRFEHVLTAEHDTDTTVSRVISVDTLELGLATGGN